MRNAETVLGVIREREFQAETTGELLEIERLTSSLEGGGGNRTQPVSRKGLRTPAQADTSPAAYPNLGRSDRSAQRHPWLLRSMGPTLADERPTHQRHTVHLYSASGVA